MRTKANLSLKTLILLLFSMSHLAYAQKGNSHLSVGLELGPTLNWQSGDFPLQVGMPLKAYFGTGKRGQFLLRTGWHHFPNLSRQLDPDINSLTRTAVPLGFGYRHHFPKWYIEGSLGIAYDVILISYLDPLEEPEGFPSIEPHYSLEVGRSQGRFDLGVSFYNHGTAPFNMTFIGVKSLYRIHW